MGQSPACSEYAYDSTGEKPSFLLFGWDCRSPIEASLIPVEKDAQYTTVANYCEELMHTLSSSRQTALQSIREAQGRYKAQYERKTDSYKHKIGDWDLPASLAKSQENFASSQDLGTDRIV